MRTIDSPTIIVFFGITGDLARKKLIPAILDLESAYLLPDSLKIIGFSRREYSDKIFVEFVRDSINAKKHHHTKKTIDRFCARLTYCEGEFEDKEAYKRLGEKILSMEREEFGQCANKLLYLAVSPAFYEVIFRELAFSGLTIPCVWNKTSHAGARAKNKEPMWARVLVEKPFGRDTKTAENLDKLLGKLFKEEQIFRIDHYLAKETVQNLLSFRFSNALFEPLWRKEHIERVNIRLLEKDSVGERGAFYDGIGALRDVGQNHLLQMLALIALEQPREFTATCIRPARANLLKQIRVFGGKGACMIRAQYAGYREEKNVDANSDTETYFKIKVEVLNERWRRVPFILESGKAREKSKTDIEIVFKPPSLCLACRENGCIHSNKLLFNIQPNEGITISFWVKKPGLDHELELRELFFSYSADLENRRIPDAYERLLYDALVGEQMLFTSTSEVEASWRFITQVQKKLEKSTLHTYKPGEPIDTLKHCED